MEYKYTMIITIDCEWDGFETLSHRSGDLISMALVAENGEEFYEVLPYSNLTTWVENNVVPVLNKQPIPRHEFQTKLSLFLNKFDDFVLVADWPEDIAKFCEVLITGAGMRMDTPTFNMQILRIDSNSVVPHNALEDARALMDSVLSLRYPRKQ